MSRWHEQTVEQKRFSFQKGPFLNGSSHSACLCLRLGQSSEASSEERCLFKVWLSERAFCQGYTVGTVKFSTRETNNGNMQGLILS